MDPGVGTTIGGGGGGAVPKPGGIRIRPTQSVKYVAGSGSDSRCPAASINSGK